MKLNLSKRRKLDNNIFLVNICILILVNIYFDIKSCKDHRTNVYY